MIDAETTSGPTRIRWRIFALACGTSFLLYLHRSTWAIVGPLLQEELHLSNTDIGLLFSMFYYTYAGGQIPSGVVVDRFGLHRFLSASIAAWSVAILLIGQTTIFPLLALSRLVFGAAQAGCYPALAKVTRNWFPTPRRTMVQGWIATTFGRAGGAMSPLILGTVLMGWIHLNWHQSLMVLGFVGVGYSFVFWRLFRERPSEHPGVNAEEIALIEEGAKPAITTVPTTMPMRRAWKSRSLRFFVLQQFLDAGSDVAFLSLIGTFFLRARGIEIARTGWLASLPLWGGALGGIVGGSLNDWLIQRTGFRRWSRSAVGFVGKTLGCGLLLQVVPQTDVTLAALFLMAAKFFSDWSQPTTWGTCTDLGGRYSATVFSIVNTAGTSGGIVMPILFGRVLDAFTTKTMVSGKIVSSTDWNPLFFVLALMYLGSGVCWLFVDCTKSLDDDKTREESESKPA